MLGVAWHQQGVYSAENNMVWVLMLDADARCQLCDVCASATKWLLVPRVELGVVA